MKHVLSALSGRVAAFRLAGENEVVVLRFTYRTGSGLLWVPCGRGSGVCVWEGGALMTENNHLTPNLGSVVRLK